MRRPQNTSSTDKELADERTLMWPYLWMQDASQIQIAVCKCDEENVADLGTKPLSKAVIAKHCLAPGYVDMSERNVW